MDKGRTFGIIMTCSVCNLNKELYLYSKSNLIYSLCKSCLNTQNQIDEANKYIKRETYDIS